MSILGKSFKNNFGAEFKVLSMSKNKRGSKKYYKIKFKDYGFGEYETESQKSHILEGVLKNPYYPNKTYNGCYGKPNKDLYNKDKFQKIRQKWYNMMRRCYDKNNQDYHTYGGNGVIVCKRWRCFEYFLEDFSKIKGYEDYFEDKVLDKDLSGNKEYSLPNCIFLTESENSKETRTRNCQYFFKGINPDGVKYISNNQSQFAIEHNLLRSRISSCLKKKQKTHKGWRFEII